MSGPGRPRIEIDWETFEKLCAILCTLEDMAGFFDCSVDTLQRRVQEHYGEGFTEVFKTKSAKGKVSLRRKQYEIAMKGNVVLLIWLGKQFLGQTDKPAGEASNERPVVQLTDAQMIMLVQAARGDK